MAGQGKEWTVEQQQDEFSVFRRGFDLKIVLTRPRKGNVLNMEMLDALTTIYRNAAQAKSIFRIILTAEGKYFCTGMDLGARGGVLDEDQDAKQKQWHAIQDLFDAIDNAPQVTLALVNGPAFGAGIGLAFACDIRIATDNTTFHVSEAKVGIAPAVIMKWVLREWGTSRGREAMLTGRAVTASELLSAGVVHGVDKDARELDAAADEYIQLLKGNGPEALTAIKSITLASESRRDKMIKDTYDRMMAPTDEARYGVESFHKKEKPNWEDFYTRRRSKL